MLFLDTLWNQLYLIKSVSFIIYNFKISFLRLRASSELIWRRTVTAAASTQPAFTCLKLAMEALVWNQFENSIRHLDDVVDIVLILFINVCEKDAAEASRPKYFSLIDKSLPLTEYIFIFTNPKNFSFLLIQNIFFY